MRPSEYFDRNCWIGASAIRRREVARRHEIGINNLMWANDFPHPEGTWPHTRQSLAETFHDVPVHETERILGLNAADVYGFDAESLQPLVERIRPTPADLGQPAAVACPPGWDEPARPWLRPLEVSLAR